MTYAATSFEPGAIADVSWRVAIVVSQYHADITSALSSAARRTLNAAGLPDQRIDQFETPGAWELPLACQWILDRQRHQALVALGAVIRGETSHDQHINRFVSTALGQLSLDTGIPIAFGLLTCDSLEQARARSGGAAGNKGEEAAAALVAMVNLKRRIDEWDEASAG